MRYVENLSLQRNSSSPLPKRVLNRKGSLPLNLEAVCKAKREEQSLAYLSCLKLKSKLKTALKLTYREGFLKLKQLQVL